MLSLVSGLLFFWYQGVVRRITKVIFRFEEKRICT